MKQIIRPCIEAQLQLENRKMRMDCVQHQICPDCGDDLIKEIRMWGDDYPYCDGCKAFFDKYGRSYTPNRKDNRR